MYILLFGKMQLFRTYSNIYADLPAKKTGFNSDFALALSAA